MKFFNILWRIELVAIIALVFAACITGILAFIQSTWWAANGQSLVIEPLDVLWVVTIYAVVIGLLPVVLFGAPIYTWLKTRSRVSWLNVLGLGVLPGIVVFPLEKELSIWVILCGCLVAISTHALSKRFIT
jgi:hypothetical protein